MKQNKTNVQVIGFGELAHVDKNTSLHKDEFKAELTETFHSPDRVWCTMVVNDCRVVDKEKKILMNVHVKAEDVTLCEDMVVVHSGGGQLYLRYITNNPLTK